MALRKLEYLIANNSAVMIADAITTVVANLNTQQEVVTNKIDATTYKNDYFASLIDTRTSDQYLVYSDVAKDKYSVGENSVLISASGSGSETIVIE